MLPRAANVLLASVNHGYQRSDRVAWHRLAFALSHVIDSAIWLANRRVGPPVPFNVDGAAPHVGLAEDLQFT